MDSISGWNGNLIAPFVLQPGNDGAEVAEMANNPRIHEIIEDEVNSPALVLIGK